MLTKIAVLKNRCFAAAAIGAVAALVSFVPVASADLPRVALCETVNAEGVDTQSKLMGTGDFSAVDLIDCHSTTPSLATLQGYSGVMVWSDNTFANSAALGDNLADYADGGGTVVLAAFGDTTVGGAYQVEGRLRTSSYSPFVPGTAVSGTQMTLAADVPGNQLLNGVSSFNGGTNSWHDAVTLNSGATQVAHWTDGTPLVAFKGNVVGLNFFPYSSDSVSGDWLSSTNGAQLMADALQFNDKPPAGQGAPRGAYCTVAGNTSDSGAPLFPGTFVNLDDGQASSDPHYAGATPANFIAGTGLTCAPPPAGYTHQGFATGDMNVDANTYPYWAAP